MRTATPKLFESIFARGPILAALNELHATERMIGIREKHCGLPGERRSMLRQKNVITPNTEFGAILMFCGRLLLYVCAKKMHEITSQAPVSYTHLTLPTICSV